MPADKPYPGEDPAVARKRIARNRGVSPQPGLTPITQDTGQPRPMAPEPQLAPRAKKGYNFTRNLGVDDTPDIGY